VGGGNEISHVVSDRWYGCMDRVHAPPRIISTLYETHISLVYLFNKCFSIFNYQPEDGQRKGPKHVVDLNIINHTFTTLQLYQTVYTHSNLMIRNWMKYSVTYFPSNLLYSPRLTSLTLLKNTRTNIPISVM